MDETAIVMENNKLIAQRGHARCSHGSHASASAVVLNSLTASVRKLLST
jgi:hypothetical protein